MAIMKAAQISGPGADFELVERPVPEPGPGQVRVKVEACGICHSDMFVKDGLFPGIEYPRIPGHEVAGTLDALGSGVRGWTTGLRVGVGWHGGHCFHCAACRAGDFINCADAQVTGIHFDGGYAQYLCAPAEAVAAIPDELKAVDAAPLLCAGITVYNALRSSGARPGDVVAIQGLGGLGHLAVQYAQRMGFRTVAISHGDAKRALAQQLGAHHYIDTRAEDPAQSLLALGGARVILATAPSSPAIGTVLDGLAPNGSVMVVGADAQPIPVTPLQLIRGRHRLQGWASGSAQDSEDTMRFSTLTKVSPMVETYPLAQVSKAYERMITNQARFRVVLTMV